ncbi:hypothetical protein NP233_g4607 [Leucocoprinus birnbaumii]|uniref:EXS domain-containing protein n=1 Tax=Leucocoprinus birnbaumii TaxID=56174 RepID=A0AAD5VV02_9AGAR|nr:hypothetical protein NP233_g4607 [Leucocoprinus birnbaumii]
MERYIHGGALTKTRHFSTFRSGVLTGVAIPALVSGLYYCSLKETHADIQGWDALLYIYGIFFIPVVFSMLVGLNLLVWVRSRVKYTTIFGFDIQDHIDYRDYFEIPSLLFATLCLAFWLSFSRIGSTVVSPIIWPIVWLSLTAVILLNPLPLQYRSSRYWLLRSSGKLFTSFTHRVKFTDFWLADQFCSLIFTLSNLYTFVCIYVEGFEGDWNHTCASRSNAWPVAFLLAALPLLIRLAQSIKRYADSGMDTHLVNAGEICNGYRQLSLLFSVATSR